VKRQKEFSKQLLNSTRIIFIISLIVACWFTWEGKDTTVFIYIISSTGGTYGAAIIFYLNKAKMENVFKGRVEFLKFKLELMKQYPPEQQGDIETEISQVDSALGEKIQSVTNDAVSEDVSIQNY
jgi:hypothetical protein